MQSQNKSRIKLAFGGTFDWEMAIKVWLELHSPKKMFSKNYLYCVGEFSIFVTNKYKVEMYLLRIKNIR